MEWSNLDEDWIRLYIHLNRDLCTEIEHIEHLLPSRRKGRRGREAGMGVSRSKEEVSTRVGRGKLHMDRRDTHNKRDKSPNRNCPGDSSENGIYKRYIHI